MSAPGVWVGGLAGEGERAGRGGVGEPEGEGGQGCAVTAAAMFG